MGRHAFKVVTSVQKYGAIIPFVRPFSYSFNRKWDRQMCQGFMNTWRNQFHFIFHTAAYSQSVIETYLVNCLETDNNNNDNQTSVQGLLFCPVSTCVTRFSFSLLSQSHHIPSSYHSWNKAVWKPKGFTRENCFQQISRKRLVWEQSWKKKLGFIFDFSPG